MNDILDKIKDNSILIVPNNIKNNVIKYFSSMHFLRDIKIVDLNYIKKHFYFDYNEEAILYIMENYDLNIDTSKDILELLYFIEDKKYNINKLDFLRGIKNNLIKEKLLLIDPLFKNYIRAKNIYIFGYSNIDKFNKQILDNINATYLDLPMYDDKKSIYLFNTLEEEVENLFIEICKLVDNGTSLNNIKLTNVDDKYYYTIRRYSELFNIPVSINNESIYSSFIVKEYLKTLKETSSFTIALDRITNKFDLSNERNNLIYDVLFKISNKYNDLNYSFSNIYKLVKYDIKKSSLKETKLEQCVDIVNLDNNIFSSSDYIFLLGFNQENIPKIYKDEEYITDLIKLKYLPTCPTSVEKNILSRNSVINSIRKIKNIYISCKEKSINSEFTISSLVNDLEYNIDYIKQDYSKIYSNSHQRLRLSKYIDDFLKYGIYNEQLELLYNNTDINYLSYSNKFSHIDKNLLLDKLKKGIKLSYSSLDNYYHCAFRYYINNFLKLDSFTENFSTMVGNLFHYILSICFRDNFNYDIEYDSYIKKLSLSYKELFFINKLKKELQFVVSEVQRLQKETSLDNLLLEHKIIIDKSTNIDVKFVGIVDKIMYKEGNPTLVNIIDYKTGNADINLDNIKYGLSMQLPIYLYLVKRSNLFKNIRFTGFYLQKVLFNEISFSLSKSYIDQKKSNIKLVGYSNNDISILREFIPDYENSSFVKSMKTTADGFYYHAKIIDDDKINKLVLDVEEKIEQARDSIISGDFAINPKQIKDEKIGCQYCKYRDICFRTNNDFIKCE